MSIKRKLLLTGSLGIFAIAAGCDPGTNACSDSETVCEEAASGGAQGDEVAVGGGGQASVNTSAPGSFGLGPSSAPGNTQVLEAMVTGKHLQIDTASSESSSDINGSVSVMGGEQLDMYFCSDKTFSAHYEDTSCVSVSVPGMDGSSCGDGPVEVGDVSGTWEIGVMQGTTVLKLITSEGTFGIAISTDGETLYLEDIAPYIEPNPYCV